jgi:cGMP-dependent protein kinase
MDKASFDMLLGPLDLYIKRSAAGTSTRKSDSPKMLKKLKSKELPERTGPRISRADLKTIGLLGCGGFGAVSLVQHKTTKEIYAYKEMHKGHIVQTKMQKSVFRERDIQLACDSVFIVKLYETFNTSTHLGFLLEVCSGGELYDTYHRKGLHGSMKHAKFYAASVMYAFDHMHERKILYRDLKPENLLFTKGGFLKITDMGLAKVSPGPTHTMCGTPDYLAPEVISGAGHNIGVDWWTLGILTYEFIIGRAPFYAPSPMVIYKNVGKGIDKVSFPSKHGVDWADFVKSLCKEDPADRAPMRKGGSDNLRKSGWYKGFDFKALVQQTATPPYKPAIKSTTDRGCFFPQESDRPPQPKYVDDGSGWDKGFETSK